MLCSDSILLVTDKDRSSNFSFAMLMLLSFIYIIKKKHAFLSVRQHFYISRYFSKSNIDNKKIISELGLNNSKEGNWKRKNWKKIEILL